MTEREAILRDFVEWFDRRFPPLSLYGPELSLWQLAERARKVLTVKPDSGLNDDPDSRDDRRPDA